MKKPIVLVLLIAAMLFVAGSAFALVAGTPHDFQTGFDAAGQPYAGGTLSACQYCHTPHFSNTAGAPAPLWNRDMSTAAITVYGGGTTLSGTTVNQPGALTKACLSCHDGTIAVGALFNGGSGGTITSTSGDLDATGKIINPNTLIGPDLSNDHPVGFTPITGNAGVYYDATAHTLSNAAGAAITFPVYADGAGGVYQMECGTCHNPHDETNQPFLRAPISGLCTDCHAY